jgi:streptomycin 6-kinase
VLKVAWQHTEARHEAEGLAALGGQGAVEVYAFEHLAPSGPGAGPGGDTTAMLLERCRPGAELRGSPEAEQHVVVTDMLRSVWAVELPYDHPFRPLSVMADEWVLQAEARLAADPGRLDAGLAREGLALFRELSRTGPPDVLLFTDLHAGNVLSAQGRPWLLGEPRVFRTVADGYAYAALSSAT